MQGRAGLLATLAAARRHLPGPWVEQALSRHLRMLGLHAVPHGTGTAFPGHQLLRLSMDLATGSAGVLPAVTAAVDRDAAVLPFLGERTTADVLAASPH
ncbi:hypothetical protein ACIQMJ_26770 [Actinosynnema sp. NPDC091369]